MDDFKTYREKLRERLLSKESKLLPKTELQEDVPVLETRNHDPFGYWKNKPKAKRNLSENRKESPINFDWNSKAGSQNVNLMAEEKPAKKFLKEEPEQKKVDTFSVKKYKVL